MSRSVALIGVALALIESACAHVAPYERGRLAQPMMTADDLLPPPAESMGPAGAAGIPNDSARRSVSVASSSFATSSIFVTRSPPYSTCRASAFGSCAAAPWCSRQAPSRGR